MTNDSVYKQIVMVFGLVILGLNACAISTSDEYQYPQLGNFQETGNYLIDPETILTALDKGESDVFTPLLGTPDPNMKHSLPGSIPWTDTEYLVVANALSQLIWSETTNGWKVYYIEFTTECHDNPQGFDSFTAIYFKPIEINSKVVYTVRQISIDPLFRQASWGGGENFPRPNLNDWDLFSLNEIKVSAYEAFQIAENNGGKEARLKVNNNCRILVSAPYDEDEYWDVHYYPGVYFEVLIDPFTGGSKVINTGQ